MKKGGRNIDVVVAKARSALHKTLIQTLETNLSPGWSDPHQAFIVAFENAFAKHAGAILCDVAAEVKAKDAEECLAKLRGEITEAIVQWIEPSEEHFEDELRLRLTDLTPDGEWEQRLEEAYQIFRAQHPLGGSPEADATDFRFSFEYRLRFKRHRAPFEAKLKSVLHGAIIDVEPTIRAQFPARIKVSELQSQKRRGFPPKSEEHRCVLAALERFGDDWPEHLTEICGELVGVAVPESWRKQGYRSWRRVAQALAGGNPQLRSLVRKHFQYRVRWSATNR